jgi:hypothetical protein
VHETNVEAWCRDTHKLWDKGILHLDNAEDGDASIRWIRQADIL